MINRRDFLKVTGVGVAFVSLGGFAGAEESVAGKKPNILLIMSDEHNSGILGCYGNKIVKTVNLDSLSKNGITFDACYTNSPLCVPSRESFVSGKYISRYGVWSNSSELPNDDVSSVPHLLNAAGYESFLCGKMHLQSGRHYGYTEIGDDNEHHKSGKVGRMDPDLKPVKKLSNRFEKFYAGDDSPIIAHDTWVTEKTIDFLKNRKAGGKPFFLTVGYHAPHFPLIVPQAYFNAYKDKVPMPNIPEGYLDSLPRNYKALRNGFSMEKVPDDIVKKGRELYYGLTQWLDEEVGKVLGALKDSVLAENTIIIYTTDHGENMGEHGLWWKNCVYDSAARIPLIVSWPGKWKGGQRRAGACSLVDVASTIVDMGGGKTPGDWDGTSMIKWMDDSSSSWKDMAISEYYSHCITSGYVMIRKGSLKYTYHTPADDKHPAEKELYDLAKDPGEFKNLAGDLEYKDKVAELHDALLKEMCEHPDDTEKRCRAEGAKGYPDAGGGGKKQKKNRKKGKKGSGSETGNE